MNQISFTANFITNTTIQKKENLDRPYQKEDAAIVELDINDESDMSALEDIKNTWKECGGTYITNIYKRASGTDYKDPNIIKDHFYALTTQKEDFKELRPSQILGVAVFSERDGEENELSYMEVEPSVQYPRKNRKYKEVGDALLKFMSKTFNKKPYYVSSSLSAIGFYTKYDFYETDEYHPSCLTHA